MKGYPRPAPALKRSKLALSAFDYAYLVPVLHTLRMQEGVAMHAYKKYVNLFLFLFLVFLTIRADPLYFKNHVVPAFDQTGDTLYEEIEEKAQNDEYYEAAKDAYIDRVWKKTPGRNGKKINVDRSYQNMRSTGTFHEDLLVYDEIEPEVGLDDLPVSPIYRGHPEKMMTSLMINVSWGEEHIPVILNTLEEKNVKANFFIEGKWAREHTELVQMIAEKGHLVGNHAYNHPDMARLNAEEITNQLKQTNEILQAITGEQPVFFTPPSGSFNDHVVEKAAEEGMETVLWTADTIDWKKPSVSVMINRVNSKIHPGAIILMHPTPVIAEGLGELLEILEEQEYRIGRLDALFSTER
jgi:probable sporulation protein (polysaccharide deacetylase family)